MKKWIALLLALVLTCCLVGCAGKPEILGTYQTEVDLYDVVVENFDIGTGMTGTDHSLANYLSDFKINVIFVFNEDGTYSSSVDHDSIVSSLDELKTAIVPLMNDLIFTTFKEQFAPLGFTIESQADIEAIVGMSWDEIFSSALGKTAEEFVSDLINESFTDALTAGLLTEGKFLAKEGKLHLSDDLNTAAPKDSYETYEISGDTITFTGAVNLEEEPLFVYPYVLTLIEPAA